MPRPGITLGVAVGVLALLALAAVAAWQTLGWWCMALVALPTLLLLKRSK